MKSLFFRPAKPSPKKKPTSHEATLLLPPAIKRQPSPSTAKPSPSPKNNKLSPSTIKPNAPAANNKTPSNIPEGYGLTLVTYLEASYKYFNEHLFDNALPPVVILLQREKGAGGYAWRDRWHGRANKDRVHELAINPDSLSRHELPQLLSIVVHEMCHIQEFGQGHVHKRNYHTKAWGQLMEAVGLVPSATGEVGGKRTGHRMSHYVPKVGVFLTACEAFMAANPLTVHLISPGANELSAADGGADTDGETGKDDGDTSKAGKREKYTCPECDMNVRGKFGIRVACIECECEMVASEGDTE